MSWHVRFDVVAAVFLGWGGWWMIESSKGDAWPLSLIAWALAVACLTDAADEWAIDGTRKELAKHAGESKPASSLERQRRP